MTALDLNALIRHGQDELARVENTLAAHSPGATGCCGTCGRPWPCATTTVALRWQNHWDARMADYMRRLADAKPPLVIP